jgi:hypothetical protein
MVESALEFARIARDLDYHDFVFSMKASNPKVMIAAYRLLVARLNELGPGLELSAASRSNEAGEGRRCAHQERDRNRVAAGGWNWRYHSAFRSLKIVLTNSRGESAHREHCNTSNAEHRTSKSNCHLIHFSYRGGTEKTSADGVKLGWRRIDSRRGAAGELRPRSRTRSHRWRLQTRNCL